MHCNGSNANIFGANKCNEFLAFNSLEVRFLVDSSSCSNKSLIDVIVMMILYFFD